MAKLGMVCPFSKTACKDCALFRGRHFYLCSAPSHPDFMWAWSKTTGYSRTRPRGSGRLAVEKPPELPKSSKWIENIEDLIERREE